MNADPHSLANLQDIVEPEAIALFPFATGLWLLLTLVALWSSAGLVLGYLRWRSNAYRRIALHALSELQVQLRSPESRPQACIALSELLKRVALAAYPREEVASLSGAAWQAFLERTGVACHFSSETGRLFSEGVYKPGMIQSEDCDKVVALAERWIRSHRVDGRA